MRKDELLRNIASIAAMDGAGSLYRNNLNVKPLKQDEGKEERPKYTQPAATVPASGGGSGGGSAASVIPTNYSPLAAPVYNPTSPPDMQIGSLPQTQQMYEQYLAQLQAQPGAYTSQYRPQMDSLYQQMDRGPFKYDLNADMLYQQMKDQYIQNAQRSMMDAQGQAAALTGGYGSSYGQQLGQQQYDQHLTQLHNNIPELYDRKYNEWLNEGNELANRFNMAASLEGLDYNQYRDSVSDWQNMLGHTAQMYDSQANRDIDTYQAQMNAWLQGENLNLDRARFEAERFDQQQAQAREIALSAFASGKTPPTEVLEQAGYSPSVAQLLADIYKPKPSGGSGAKQIKFNFTMDEIALAADAYETGGESGLDRYMSELILTGKSPEEAVQLRTHISQNYKYTPSTEPTKGDYEPYVPAPVWNLQGVNLSSVPQVKELKKR